MSALVRALGNYREMPAVLVREGELWPADHPVVQAHPDWFDLGAPAAPVEQATAAPGERRVTRRSATRARPHLPSVPGPPEPLPNQSDDAWAELERLRAVARTLGIDVDERWPLIRLREEIAAARERR